MIKLFYTLFFLLIFLIKSSYAEKIQSFNIIGNERISDQTVILFSGLKLKQEIDSQKLNDSLKKLYETTFFENVSVSFDNNILTIELIENPLIQNIEFVGIKRESLIEKIKDMIQLKEKSSFVENKIKYDQDLILNVLRVNGYYFSEVETTYKKNDNNTIDIFYNIELGERALIKNIKFVGNKVFKDNKLRKVNLAKSN